MSVDYLFLHCAQTVSLSRPHTYGMMASSGLYHPDELAERHGGGWHIWSSLTFEKVALKSFVDPSNKRSGLQFLLCQKKSRQYFFHSFILFWDVAPELGLINWKDHELLIYFFAEECRKPTAQLFFCSIKTVEQWHSVVLCCYQKAFKYCWVLQNPTPDLVAFTSKNCLNSSYSDLLYVPKASCPPPPHIKEWGKAWRLALTSNQKCRYK